MHKVCKSIEVFETWVKIETTNRVVNKLICMFFFLFNIVFFFTWCMSESGFEMITWKREIVESVPRLGSSDLGDRHWMSSIFIARIWQKSAQTQQKCYVPAVAFSGNSGTTPSLDWKKTVYPGLKYPQFWRILQNLSFLLIKKIDVCHHMSGDTGI